MGGGSPEGAPTEDLSPRVFPSLPQENPFTRTYVHRNATTFFLSFVGGDRLVFVARFTQVQLMP